MGSKSSTSCTNQFCTFAISTQPPCLGLETSKISECREKKHALQCYGLWSIDLFLARMLLHKITYRVRIGTDDQKVRLHFLSRSPTNRFNLTTTHSYISSSHAMDSQPRQPLPYCLIPIIVPIRYNLQLLIGRDAE